MLVDFATEKHRSRPPMVEKKSADAACPHNARLALLYLSTAKVTSRCG